MEHPTFPCLLLTLLFVMTGKPNLVATGAVRSLGLGLAASLLAIPLRLALMLHGKIPSPGTRFDVGWKNPIPWNRR